MPLHGAAMNIYRAWYLQHPQTPTCRNYKGGRCCGSERASLLHGPWHRGGKPLRICTAISPSVAPSGNTSKFWGMTIEDLQVSEHGAAAAWQGWGEVLRSFPPLNQKTTIQWHALATAKPSSCFEGKCCFSGLGRA